MAKILIIICVYFLCLLVIRAKGDFKTDFFDFMHNVISEQNLKIIIRPIKKHLRSISLEILKDGILRHLDIIQISEQNLPQDDQDAQIFYNKEVLSAYKDLQNTLTPHQIKKYTIYSTKGKDQDILQQMIKFSEILKNNNFKSFAFYCLETKQLEKNNDGTIEKCQLKTDNIIYKTILNDIGNQKNPVEIFTYKFNKYKNLNELFKFNKSNEESFIHKIVWKLNLLLEIAFQVKQLKENGYIDRSRNFSSFFYRNQNVGQIHEFDSISMINSDFIIQKIAHSENEFSADIYSLGNVFNQILFGLDQEIEFLDIDISANQKKELLANKKNFRNLQVQKTRSRFRVGL